MVTKAFSVKADFLKEAISALDFALTSPTAGAANSFPRVRPVTVSHETLKMIDEMRKQAGEVHKQTFSRESFLRTLIFKVHEVRFVAPL